MESWLGVADNDGEPAPDAVRARPIVFSASMIRAILAGRKTVTRRIITRVACKGSGGWDRPRLLRTDPAHGAAVFGDAIPDDPSPHHVRCIYGAEGEHLWPRETWACMCRVADPWCHCESDEERRRHHYIEYRADTNNVRPGEWPAPIVLRGRGGVGLIMPGRAGIDVGEMKGHPVLGGEATA